MASAWVNEFAFDEVTGEKKTISGGQSQVDYTSGAAQSDAFSSETRIIQFYSEANAYYRVGANPTAAIGDPIALLIGGGGKHTTIAVEPGQKISFLAV